MKALISSKAFEETIKKSDTGLYKAADIPYMAEVM